MSVLSTAKSLKHGLSRARDVKNRTLRAVGLMATDRCSSRCKHCFIWNKKENHDLDVGIIASILEDDVVTRKTYFELTGGEFLEHPGGGGVDWIDHGLVGHHTELGVWWRRELPLEVVNDDYSGETCLELADLYRHTLREGL